MEKTYTVIGSLDLEIQAESTREAKEKACVILKLLENGKKMEHYITMVVEDD